MKAKHHHIAAALFCTLAFLSSIARAAEPLPSWQDDKARQAIIGFVEKVTKEDSPDFVPVAERIATFDNDPSDSKPSGKIRQIQYKLHAGEAGWLLKVDKVIEF